MLEGILDKRNEQQRRHVVRAVCVVLIDAKQQLVAIAHTHQLDVIRHELHLFGNGHQFMVALVEHIAQDFRQLDDSLLGPLTVDVDQRMDVVQRVHQEVRVQLVLQVLQLLLEVLFLKSGHLQLVTALLEVELDTEVGKEHQDKDNDGRQVVRTELERRPFAIGLAGRPLAVEHWRAVVVSHFRRTVVTAHHRRTVPLFHHGWTVTVYHLMTRTASLLANGVVAALIERE